MENTITEELMENEINKTQKTDLLWIDPRLIRVVEDFNTRIDYHDMDGLEQSIVANGVKKPLQGYKEGDFYFLIDGARRHKAVMSAIAKGYEIARVPFMSGKKTTIEERTLAIILSNDGEPLTPLELGITYQRLLSFGMTQTEIARRTGKTQAHISSMIMVAGSGSEVKTMISNGDVSATLVAEVKNKIKDVDQAEEIIKKAVQKKKSADTTQKSTDTTQKSTKVTKKDLIEFFPPQETYTAAEVHLLLKQQIRACSDMVPILTLKERILQTKVLMELTPVEQPQEEEMLQ